MLGLLEVLMLVLYKLVIQQFFVKTFPVMQQQLKVTTGPTKVNL
jgi:hypothetical protein